MDLLDEIREVMQRAQVQIDPLEYLERNELGDAQLFRDLLSERLALDHAEWRWILWFEGPRRPDATGAVYGLVANLVAEHYFDDDARLGPAFPGTALLMKAVPAGPCPCRRPVLQAPLQQVGIVPLVPGGLPNY